jgi:hypothetical protein
VHPTDHVAQDNARSLLSLTPAGPVRHVCCPVDYMLPLSGSQHLYTPFEALPGYCQALSTLSSPSQELASGQHANSRLN